MPGIDKLVEITSGIKPPTDTKIVVQCDVSEAEMLEKINNMIEAMHSAYGGQYSCIGNLILTTSDGCFTIKNGDRLDKETELVPIDAKIVEPFIAANSKAAQKTVLNILSEKPRFSGRRGKGDRIRDRQNWRGKWR